MGFDLTGLCAQSKTGEYFRNNCWRWRPLAHYVLTTCSDLFESDETEYWQSNDGQKVSANTARAIANRLESLIESGATQRYAEKYKEEIEAEGDIDCWLCEGTGMRNDINGLQIRHKNPDFQCNGCDGKGRVRPDSSHYPFSVENVREFATFCRESGGFEIW